MNSLPLMEPGPGRDDLDHFRVRVSEIEYVSEVIEIPLFLDLVGAGS
jgi:hypothetical protein